MGVGGAAGKTAAADSGEGGSAPGTDALILGSPACARLGARRPISGDLRESRALDPPLRRPGGSGRLPRPPRTPRTPWPSRSSPSSSPPRSSTPAASWRPPASSSAPARGPRHQAEQAPGKDSERRRGRRQGDAQAALRPAGHASRARGRAHRRNAQRADEDAPPPRRQPPARAEEAGEGRPPPALLRGPASRRRPPAARIAEKWARRSARGNLGPCSSSRSPPSPVSSCSTCSISLNRRRTRPRTGRIARLQLHPVRVCGHACGRVASCRRRRRVAE